VPDTLVEIEIYPPNDGDRIPYLIGSLPSSIPPWYPCTNPDNPPGYCGFIYNETLFTNLGAYRYGENKLPKFYRSEGRLSIQSQLENYLNKMIPSCANFTALVNNPELAAYNITNGTPSTEVRFDENSITVDLKYPITFQVQGIPPIIKFVNFSSTLNVRFKRVYDSKRRQLP
jgi:hypothetical protein